jgi:magnesium-transporting ATPase (P-type)
VDRDSETIKIEVFGRIEVWRNLKMFEFSSERKMMSRLMENVETGEVRLFLKGADCAVMDRSTVVDGKLVEAVDGFANRGLRTLAFATRPFA